jgi:hypothetical protein
MLRTDSNPVDPQVKFKQYYPTVKGKMLTWALYLLSCTLVSSYFELVLAAVFHVATKL